jgi:hypothetical protein
MTAGSARGSSEALAWSAREFHNRATQKLEKGLQIVNIIDTENDSVQRV